MAAIGRSTSTGGFAGLLALVAATGCEPPADPSADSDSAAPFVVSNPRRGGASGGSAVAYVALPEGGLPGIASAAVRIGTAGQTIAATLARGGLDPVAVRASAGDMLDVWVETAGTTGARRFRAAVPVFARPVVIRTNPAQGTRDVALNPIVAIVFSEPVDPGTVDRSSVVLRTGSNPVPGTVVVTGAPGTSVTFTPDGPLDPATEYELEVTQGVRDLDGATLEAPVRVRFTTTGGPIQPVDGTIAFTRVAPYERATLMWSRDGRTAGIPLAGVSQSVAEPSWSPDGSRLVADLVSGDLRDGAGGPPEPAGDIILVTPSPNGADASWRRLTLDGRSRSAHWAPDGRRIAFVAGLPAQSHIYLMDVEAGTPVRLTSQEGHYGTPRWSPDGHRLAFRLEQGEDAEIFVIRVDGSGLTNVSQSPFDDSGPSWSPDGTHLAFESERVGQCRDGSQSCDFTDLFVVDADGRNPTRLTFGRSGVWRDGAVWSPDGRRLALSLSTYAGGWNRDGLSGIYVMDADGSNLVRITAAPIGWADTSPTWTR